MGSGEAALAVHIWRRPFSVSDSFRCKTCHAAGEAEGAQEATLEAATPPEGLHAMDTLPAQVTPPHRELLDLPRLPVGLA